VVFAALDFSDLLEHEVAATGKGSNVQEIETVASQWQAPGFNASPMPIPPQSANLDERRATVRGRVTSDLMKLLADEVPLVPIYVYGTGVIARKGVSGPGMLTPLQTDSAWNIESWEIR
jgi:hypothetical protein